MKTKTELSKKKWHCNSGNHETVGSRYANMREGFDCWEHTPYLK